MDISPWSLTLDPCPLIVAMSLLIVILDSSLSLVIFRRDAHFGSKLGNWFGLVVFRVVCSLSVVLGRADAWDA